MYSPLSDKSGRVYDQEIDQRLRALRPDPEGDIRIANDVLEGIRVELQNGLPFNSADFQMAGSLKKDTMLTSRKEIDIVISIPQNLQGFPANEDTRQIMLDNLAVYYGVDRRENPRFHNIIIKKSGYKVDLLPTFKISLGDFLNLNNNRKHIYKPHMSLLHVEFIHNRGGKFQEFVRFVKYWAHGPTEQDRDKYTSSFFLELVAADIFDRHSNLRYIQLFEQFLRRMKNIRKRKKRRNKFFGFKDYYSAMIYRENWIDELTVLDPVDFEDNIAQKNPQKDNLIGLVKRAKNSLKLWDEKSFGEVFKHYFNRQPL